MQNLSNPTDESRPVAESDPSELSNLGDLYFVRVKNGPIKIGRSGNVPARLRTLQSSSPFPIACLLTLPGQGWQEPLWHEALADSRLRGEWFEYGEEIADALALAENCLDDWWEPLWPPSDYMMSRLERFTSLAAASHSRQRQPGASPT